MYGHARRVMCAQNTAVMRDAVFLIADGTVHAPRGLRSKGRPRDTARINAGRSQVQGKMAFSPSARSFGQKSGAIDDMSIAAQNKCWRGSARGADDSASRWTTRGSARSADPADVWIYNSNRPKPRPAWTHAYVFDQMSAATPSCELLIAHASRCSDMEGTSTHCESGPRCGVVEDLEEERDHRRRAAAFRLRIRHRRINQDRLGAPLPRRH